MKTIVKKPISCPVCSSSKIDQFCHLPPDPIFLCENCDAHLDMHGDVWVEGSVNWNDDDELVVLE